MDLNVPLLGGSLHGGPLNDGPRHHGALYHGPLQDGSSAGRLPLSGGADDLYRKAVRRALIIVHWLPPEKVRRRRHERWLRHGLSRRGLIPPARATEPALDRRTAVDAKVSAGRRRRAIPHASVALCFSPFAFSHGVLSQRRVADHCSSGEQRHE